MTTLLRLSLNVASTRVVLLDGHTGTGAAGRVIESEREARTDLGDALGTLRDDDEVDDDGEREARTDLGDALGTLRDDDVLMRRGAARSGPNGRIYGR